MVEPKQECFVFFYWTTMDKLEFTDLSRVHWMFGCREIVIIQQINISLKHLILPKKHFLTLRRDSSQKWPDFLHAGIFL